MLLMKNNEGNREVLLRLLLHLEYQIPMNIPVPDNELLHRGHMHRGQLSVSQVHRAVSAVHRLYLRLTTFTCTIWALEFWLSFSFLLLLL